MRSLLAILSLGVFLAAGSVRAEDPLAPLTDDPLAPLTLEPAKPAKPKAKPAKPAAKPKPAAEKARPAEPKATPAEKPSRVTEPKILVDRIQLRVPALPLRAGDSTQVTIKLLDVGGKPVSAEIGLSASVGTITAPVETSVGLYTATYAAPESGPGGTATLRAEVKNAPHPTFAEGKIGLIAAEQAQVAYVPPPPSVNAPRPARAVFDANTKGEAGRKIRVRFQIEDENGNPLAPEGVVLRSEGGRTEDLRMIKRAYVADFVPAEDQAGFVVVWAEVNGERLPGEGAVSVAARSATSGEGVGVSAGIYAGGGTNFGKVSSFQLDASAELRLFQLMRLGVMAGFSPRNDTTQIPGKNGGPTRVFSVQMIPIAGRLSLQQSFGSLGLFAGGMAGVAIVSGTAQLVDPVNPDPIDLGMVTGYFAAFAGAGLQFGPGLLFAELRVPWVPFKVEQPTLQTTGSLGALSGAVGYRFDL